MRRWFSRAVCVAVFFCVGVVQRPGIAAQLRAADTMIPASAAIALTTPTNPVATLNVVQRVLAAAKVSYGLEGPPLLDPPLVDLAHPPTEIADLHNMTVGAALDAIARVDPSVRWSEHDGVIVVRLAGDRTWLDGAMSTFRVSNGDKVAALNALITAVDPARYGQVARGGQRFPTPAPSVAPEPPISVFQERGTVLDGLNAIARAARSSWWITYDGPTLDARDASIVLGTGRIVGARDNVVAASPVVVDARASRDPNIVNVPIAFDMPQAVQTYAKAAGITLGIETLPFPDLPVEMTGIRLRLDRRQPRAALAKIVAYDSRYELTEDKGVFHVRVRGGALLPSLDAPVAAFSASDELLTSVLSRIAVLSGPMPVTPQGFGDAVMINPLSASQADYEKTRQTVGTIRVSVDFSGPGSIRDVLDALCVKNGLVWQAGPAPSIRPAGLSNLTLTNASSGGWMMTRRAPWASSRTFTPLPRPTLESTSVSLPTSLETLSEVLPVAMGGRPFGAYFHQVARTPGERAEDRAAAAQAPLINPTALLVPDLLNTLLKPVPGYRWSETRGVYHILPATLTDSPDELVNRPVDHLDIQIAGLPDAMEVITQILTGRPIQRRPPSSSAVQLGSPMRFTLEHGTVRDALDLLLRTGEADSWTLTSFAGAGEQLSEVGVQLCLRGRACTSEFSTGTLR